MAEPRAWHGVFAAAFAIPKHLDSLRVRNWYFAQCRVPQGERSGRTPLWQKLK
jgi:hypothetical protein